MSSSVVERSEKSGFAPRFAFGLLLIVVGVLYTFDTLGWLEVDHLFDFWPLVIVAAGLGKFFWPASRAGRATGFVLAAIGLWMQLTLLDVLPYGTFEFWPLLLVLLGGYLVWQGLVSTQGESEGGDTASAVAVMGGVTRRSSSADFRGGDFFALMGGCEVDLRDARISNGPAVIDAFAFWGGIEIRVPDDWTVVVKVVSLLGDWSDGSRKNADAEGPEQRLVVKGFAIMGGVEIKN